MDEGAYETLIQSLAQRTEEGNLNWHPTSDENEFIVYFDDFSVSLRYQSPPRDPDYWMVTLRDGSGKKLDTSLVEQGDPNWLAVRSLHAAARRRALKVDAAISTILNELKTGNPGKKRNPKPPMPPDDDIPF